MRESAWRELSPFLRQFVIGCVNDIMIITVILNKNIIYCKSGNLFIKSLVESRSTGNKSDTKE